MLSIYLQLLDHYQCSSLQERRDVEKNQECGRKKTMDAKIIVSAMISVILRDFLDDKFPISHFLFLS